MKQKKDSIQENRAMLIYVTIKSHEYIHSQRSVCEASI